jgi:hypothetical protein
VMVNRIRRLEWDKFLKFRSDTCRCPSRKSHGFLNACARHHRKEFRFRKNGNRKPLKKAT